MGIIERNIGNLHDQDTGELVGYRNPVTGKQEDLNAPALQALVSRAWNVDYGAMATMGDSIVAASVASSAGLFSTRSRGAPIICSSYLGHPWTFDPYNHRFAVGGTGWDVILSSQLPNFLAAAANTKFAKVFISGGTNDTANNRSFESITADAEAVLSAIRGTGAMPVMWGVLPRGTDGAMTGPKRVNQRLNEWLRQRSAAGLLEFIDCTEIVADNSTAFGNALTSLMYDSPSPNLHPNAKGHYLIGKALADYFIAQGVRPRMRYATQQSDVFDRSKNPFGVCFNNANPLMQGGTTAPTGMTTSGGTWSKTSRSLPNGQTRSDPTCALAASTTHYIYDDFSATGAWGATQLQPGDVIEARALIDITNGVNLQSPTLKLTTSDGTAPTEVRALNVDLAGETIPDGNHTLHLLTPSLTIPPYSGTGNASMFSRLDVVTTAGASGTLTVRAFEVRRVA